MVEFIAWLSKNCNKVIKKFNKKNQTPNFGSSNHFERNKAAVNNTESKTRNRGI